MCQQQHGVAKDPCPAALTIYPTLTYARICCLAYQRHYASHFDSGLTFFNTHLAQLAYLGKHERRYSLFERQICRMFRKVNTTAHPVFRTLHRGATRSARPHTQTALTQSRTIQGRTSQRRSGCSSGTASGRTIFFCRTVPDELEKHCPCASRRFHRQAQRPVARPAPS